MEETEREEWEQAVLARLEEIEDGAQTLVSIPVWGWTGHGKTTALLTATQCATAEEDVLCFRLIKDTRVLERLEQENREFEGLGLPAAATVTEERVRELYSGFIDGCEWPPGTETATPYLFQALSVKGVAGYVMFPDIQGGSYQSADHTSRRALDGAHACIVVVDSRLYIGPEAISREYANDVLELLQACSQRDLPILVLLTKSDEYGGDGGVLDKARKRVALLLKTVASEATIANVSVIDDQQCSEVQSTDLPRIDERRVGNLVRAWVGVTVEALGRSRDVLLGTVPNTNLQAAKQPGSITKKSLVELRLLREYSDSPGAVLQCTGDRSSHSLYFLDSDSARVHEARINPHDGTYRFQEPTQLEEWDPDVVDVLVEVRSESVFIGAREGATGIWVGARGQGLVRAPVPFPMASWCPVSADTLIGVTEQGALHSLRLSDGKWNDAEYLDGFIEASPHMVVRFIPSMGGVVCLNGVASRAIVVDGAAKFGQQLETSVDLTFDSGHVALNEGGFGASVTADRQVLVTGASAPVGQASDECSIVAIARVAPIIAWHAQDGRLKACARNGNSIVTTGSRLSPILEGSPTGMVWSPEGGTLAVSLSDGRWGLYRTFGLAS